MTARIQLRRGTAAQWAALNPVLYPGEPGFATDTKVLKIGDGNTPWSSLVGVTGGTTGGGGGGGSIGDDATLMVWRYGSGAWPTLPTTKPDGILVLHAIGPSQPPSVPSWVGYGPTDVVAIYTYAPLT